MSYFVEWEDITNKVFELIRGNTTLLKLLCDDSKNPYSSATPRWEDVIMTRLFPVPKDPLSVGEQKTFINVYIDCSYPYDKNRNQFFREDYLVIEVGCHLETWILNSGQIKPYRMCNLIDEMLSYKQISTISMQKIINAGTKVIKFGDMFYGYKMIYKLSNTGVTNCNG